MALPASRSPGAGPDPRRASDGSRRRPPARRCGSSQVLSSSNQMYSGIGRAFFELRPAQEQVDFEIVIDDL